MSVVLSGVRADDELAEILSSIVSVAGVEGAAGMRIAELLIPPSPVDWRLYDHEVMMGWKTREEIQVRCEEQLAIIQRAVEYDPANALLTTAPLPQAKKYLGLSKLPGLVDTLSDELKADRQKKVVLCFETRDVGMALRGMLSAYKPILLFKGTPDAMRAKRVKDFATKGWCRVAVVQIQAAALFDHAIPVCFVELSANSQDNATAVFSGCVWKDIRLVLLAGTVDEALMRQRWAATAHVLEGVTV